MRGVALALGWELWRRYRLGLALTLAYLGAVAVALRARARLGGSAEPVEGYVAALPLALAALPFLAAFSYTQRGDRPALGTRFPARFLTLPVPTAALVGWPVLYGALTAALLWLATATLVLRPSGADVALAWPALACAACVTWFQAAAWWPFRRLWVRVAVLLLVLNGLLALALFGAAGDLAHVFPRAAEGVVAMGWAGLLALGYVTAAAGVARARRGEGLTGPAPWRGPARARRRRPFSGARAALLWWEWQRGAVLLPLLAAYLLPLAVAPALWFGDDPDLTFGWKLGLVLVVPLFLAFPAGGNLGQMQDEAGGRTTGFSPFLATRPVGAAAWVAAKWRAAALGAAAAWGLTALAVALALARPENAAAARRGWEQLLQLYPPWKAGAAVALAGVGLLALTWKAMVESLCVTLTGRAAVIAPAVTVALGLLLALPLAGAWAYHHPETHGPLLRLAWWAAPAAVVLKMLLAGWAAYALRRRGLASRRALACGMAAWLAAVVGLFGALAWLVPPGLASLPALALAAVLLVPLARLALAPLALEWSRHR